MLWGNGVSDRLAMILSAERTTLQAGGREGGRSKLT